MKWISGSVMEKQTLWLKLKRLTSAGGEVPFEVLEQPVKQHSTECVLCEAAFLPYP